MLLKDTFHRLISLYNPALRGQSCFLGDGYINLLNGPQDHGWCLGYTCQERISTFYAIVASHRNYSVYFTNTNPQKMRLHLLAEKEKVVRFAVYYKTTQRLDIYRKGI